MAVRVAFMGTGRLAWPTFTALCDSAHTMVGLVTQPDRTGKGHHRHVNPLKELAQARNIPVFQPEKIRSPEALATLENWQADLIVVAAYGQILPAAVLDLPRLGCINLHASLLPKYRGATPIHAAILRGETETGVTIIRLVPELDAGPILGQVVTPIGPQETTGELEGRLAELAVGLTLQVVDALESGTAVAIPQDDRLASHVGRLSKDDGWIPWEKSQREVERHIRAMQPWPGPFTVWFPSGRASMRMKILEVVPGEGASSSPAGVITSVSKEGFSVQCGVGDVFVMRLQPEGKRPMTAAEFLRGHLVRTGDRLESVL